MSVGQASEPQCVLCVCVCVCVCLCVGERQHLSVCVCVCVLESNQSLSGRCVVCCRLAVVFIVSAMRCVCAVCGELVSSLRCVLTATSVCGCIRLTVSRSSLWILWKIIWLICLCSDGERQGSEVSCSCTPADWIYLQHKHTVTHTRHPERSVRSEARDPRLNLCCTADSRWLELEHTYCVSERNASSGSAC